MYKWPPLIDGLSAAVKSYIDEGNPLSIPDESGVIKELEHEFAALHNRKHALTVSSGTMALFSSFFAIGIMPGDEVISTVYSYHATAAPLLFFGAHIVFCDVEPDTGNIDAELIERLITKKTKAIVSNDQWGHPCDKDAITRICKKHGLLYVEDCSHAHFSQYKGRYTGTFGDIACWSLQGNKLISGGEGGILLTDSDDFYERAVLLGHNMKRPAQSVKNRYYEPLFRTGFGLKLRMHPLAAVIALYQLKHCCFSWIDSRNETLGYFESQLESKTFLRKMPKREYVTSMGAWYGFYPMMGDSARFMDRSGLVAFLVQNGVEAWIPKSRKLVDYKLFTESCYDILGFEKYKTNVGFFNADKYWKSIIGFPSFTFYEYEEIDRIIGLLCAYEKAGGGRQ